MHLLFILNAVTMRILIDVRCMAVHELTCVIFKKCPESLNPAKYLLVTCSVGGPQNV